MPDILFSPDYIVWFSDLKQRISLARQQASLSLNSALIELYWEIGRDMVEKEERAAWGSGLIERLSRDLTHAFPDMKGFSRRNLYAIRQWYLFYSALSAIVPQPVAQLPWGHNRLIVSKIKDYDEALWYALAANENGWTRDDLELKIEKRDYQRVGRALTNFSQTLPAVQSGLARETLKDPYNFDFLGKSGDAIPVIIGNQYKPPGGTKCFPMGRCMDWGQPLIYDELIRGCPQ